MNTEQLEELERLAEKSLWTGRWYYADCEMVMATYGEDNFAKHRDIVHPIPLGVAKFIAAANPDTVLSLIAELRHANAQTEYFRVISRGHFDAAMGAIEELKAVQAQRDEARQNDRIAMSWIADMKSAAGIDAWTDMPGSVEALRKLKQQSEELLAALIAEQARLDFVLKKAIALYHGQLTWTDENLRTHFVGIAHPETVRSMIDWLFTQDAKKAEAGK